MVCSEVEHSPCPIFLASGVDAFCLKRPCKVSNVVLPYK